MHNPTHQLLADLTRVTSSESYLPPETEEEAAALREGWLGWTQLLQAADNEWDQTELVTRLQRQAPVPTRHGWLLATGALAASLLLVLAGTWLIGARPQAGSLRSEPSGTALVQGPIRTDSAPLAASPERTADELTWDDPLDQQLAEARITLSSLRGSWRSSDTRLTALSAQVAQFMQEMDAGSL
jgi:hypothetical protein